MVHKSDANLTSGARIFLFDFQWWMGATNGSKNMIKMMAINCGGQTYIYMTVMNNSIRPTRTNSMNTNENSAVFILFLMYKMRVHWLFLKINCSYGPYPLSASHLNM